MNENNVIICPEMDSISKIVEKKSQFLGFLFCVNSEESAKNKILELKKKYYDATHVCYAYILADNTEFYSDDKEPTGTAGLQILNAIKSNKTYNCLICIVRYFGGTKLGKQGLSDAYQKTAQLVLHNTNFAEFFECEKIQLFFSYEKQNLVRKLISAYDGRIECFGIETINAFIPKQNKTKFIEKCNLNGVKCIEQKGSIWLKNEYNN